MIIDKYFVFVNYEFRSEFVARVLVEIYGSAEDIKSRDISKVISRAFHYFDPTDWNRHNVRLRTLGMAFHKLGFKVNKRRGNKERPGTYVLTRTRDNAEARKRWKNARRAADSQAAVLRRQTQVAIEELYRKAYEDAVHGQAPEEAQTSVTTE